MSSLGNEAAKVLGSKGKEPIGAVLVCGGGIAGIQASLDLSAAGFHVYLVEEGASIGGSMARLDKTFPTGDCATCIISPKLVECMRDHNIEVLTLSNLVKLEGTAGNYTAKVQLNPRGVDANKCTGCGDCVEACPVRNFPQLPKGFKPQSDLSEEEANKLGRILSRHQSDPGALLPILQDINALFGLLPRDVLEHLSAQVGISLPEILRVASFYNEFQLEPMGRHTIEVCSGTSCYVHGKGSLKNRLQKELGIGIGETDSYGRFTLKSVRCLGLCALSPSMKIDGVSFSRVDPDRVPEILEQFE